jgi:hypothetical protein
MPAANKRPTIKTQATKKQGALCQYKPLALLPPLPVFFSAVLVFLTNDPRAGQVTHGRKTRSSRKANTRKSTERYIFAFESYTYLASGSRYDPTFFTATILEWKHLLANYLFKHIIMDSLRFTVKENRHISMPCDHR